MLAAPRGLGGDFRLVDDVGIYNESSAAKGGTRVFGEVCLVGDLGGGTLDLFISAYGGPGIDFEEVADSAKLGGNELLRKMAEDANRFLPPGWASRPEDAQTQLRAWMRSKGSGLLLGSGVAAGEAARHAGLEVEGFAQPRAAGAAHALIERYFLLIVEYMARSLVAYLVRHWYSRVLEHCPDHHERLRVLVQIRGNGWRLWPGRSKYAEIEREVARLVAARGRRAVAGPLGRPRCMARSGRPVAEARPVAGRGGRQRTGRLRACVFAGGIARRESQGCADSAGRGTGSAPRGDPTPIRTPSSSSMS